MARVFIGVDPHKLSATIEVLDDRERVLATGRFGTDQAGYAAMRKHVASFSDRTWAVEGSNGAGRPLAQRLLAYDVQLEALRLLVDPSAELSRSRIQCVNRVDRLLSELVPGQCKRDMTTGHAKTILASVRPRDVAGKSRRRLAAEQLAELVVIEKKVKALTRELKEMVLATGSTLMELPGVARSSRPAPWPTPVTSPASPTATSTHRGPAPHPWKPPPAKSSATACPGPGTGG